MTKFREELQRKEFEVRLRLQEQQFRHEKKRQSVQTVRFYITQSTSLNIEQEYNIYLREVRFIATSMYYNGTINSRIILCNNFNSNLVGVFYKLRRISSFS